MKILGIFCCMGILTGCVKSCDRSGVQTKQITSKQGSASTKTITVWLDVPQRKKAIEDIVKKFEQDWGVHVELQVVDGFTKAFETQSMIGKGPDIITWGNDVVNRYVESGLIAEIPVDDAFKSQFSQQSIEAFSYSDKLYGLPINYYVTGLFMNQDLVEKPPKTFEDVINISKKMRERNQYGLVYASSDFYFAYPLYSVYDQAIFQEIDGQYNYKKINIDTKKGHQGLELINIFFNGLFPKGLDFNLATKLFNENKAAFMINGPWAIESLRANKINYRILPFPKYKGKIMRSFLASWGFMLNKRSKQKDLAIELMKNYLVSKEVIYAMFKEEPRTPSRIDVFQELKPEEKKDLSAFQEISQQARIMPKAAEMSFVWQAYQKALTLMGVNQDVKKAAKISDKIFMNLVQKKN